MAARPSISGTPVCVVFVLLVCLSVPYVNSQTTQAAQGLNGTQPSISDGTSADDGSVLVKSMEVFYTMVKGFLKVVQPNKLKEQSWFNITNILQQLGDKGISGPVSVPQELTDWQKWSTYLLGFAICYVIGFIFAVVMPIVGCCFCCCRCCGRCGGRPKKEDPKNAKCKRTAYCTILLIFTTVMLAGVVCAFLTNHLLHRYLQNEDNEGPVGNLQTALTGLNSYVDNTINDVQNKALGTFDETRDVLVKKINSTVFTAVDEIAKSINATAFIKQAEDLSKDVNRTRDDLQDVARFLGYLQSDGTYLTNRLSEIKANLSSCGSGCSAVDTSNYSTDANFTSLSDLSAEATDVSRSLDMQTFIDQAKETLEDAKKSGTNAIKKQIDDSIKTVDRIRENVKNQTDNLKSQLEQMTKFTSDLSRGLNSTMTADFKKYYDYVFYAGIGLCSVYLLITVCYYLGILFGLCGERPGYDAPCCHKGLGANFLMAGVGFSFFFSVLLMMLVAIFFIIGGTTYTEVCQYLDTHDPNDIRFIADPIEQKFNISGTLYNKPGVEFDIVGVLNDCKENSPVYQALKLDNIFNLSSVITVKDINAGIDQIADKNINLPKITLVNAELQKRIEDFGTAGLNSIDFTQFDGQMDKKLTKANLTMLGSKLDTAAGAVTNTTTKNILMFFAGELKRLDTDYVRNMTGNVVNLKKALTSLRQHSDIKNNTDLLLKNLNTTQNKFNGDRTKLINETVKKLVVSMKDTASSNVKKLISDIENDVGRCKPIYDSIYLATDALCVTILNPFNSLWFSWGWCLFFFIPCIIFAVKLSGLYRREEEYSEKDFDDTNFATYGGANNDTIPLTSVDSRQGGGRGDYPGMANSGYHPNDDGRHRGQPSHPNGHDHNYHGSKNIPPPAYNDHHSYPSKYDRDYDRGYDPHHDPRQQRSNYPRY